MENWTVSGAVPDVGIPLKETTGNAGMGVGVVTGVMVDISTGAALTTI
jgi:hypothetical protein